MKKATVLLLFFFLISLHSLGQNDRLSDSILKQLDAAERDMVNALSNGDSTAFKKIAGYDYIDINANGNKMTLQSMLFDISNFKGVLISFSDQAQRIYGNLVLKTGRATFSSGGQEIGEVFYTQGWVYRNNKWQFVHWQGTMTKEFLQKKKN
jgi:hypothetical protein